MNVMSLMFDIKYEALAERKINFPYSYKTGVCQVNNQERY